MRRLCLGLTSLLSLVLFVPTAAAQSESLAPLLETLQRVDRGAKGNREATRAWKELTEAAQAEQLPTVLAAVDGSGPLAANWLRSAVDTIAQRQLDRQGKLPIEALERFITDKKHDPRARRLAYELVIRAEPSAAERWVPSFLDDPSLELRRDAVARVLAAAEASEKSGKADETLAAYRQALAAARDLDQVKQCTEALKKLGHPVDLAHHFGFLTDWRLIGPFDNLGGKGFDVSYPPEEKLDLAATYAGTGGTVGWVAHHTDDENGAVDLNLVLGKHMGVAGYAVAEFNSSQSRPAELRLGSENANKIWLNGKLLSYAEVYHANGTMDQYVGRGTLVSGRNVILVKLCQNEQKEDWAQDWKFHLRVCDETGKAILATDRGGPRVAKDTTGSASGEK